MEANEQHKKENTKEGKTKHQANAKRPNSQEQ